MAEKIEQCGSCRFYRAGDIGVPGACYFLPPDAMFSGGALRPTVSATDWCGQWDPLTEPEPGVDVGNAEISAAEIAAVIRVVQAVVDGSSVRLRIWNTETRANLVTFLLKVEK